VLGHPVFLVSGRELPVEEARLSLHLVARESAETEQAVARLVAGRLELWERYGGWPTSLHPAASEEVRAMARQSTGPLRLNLPPIVESMGMEWSSNDWGPKRVMEQLGAKRVIEQLGPKRVIEQPGGVDQLRSELTPEREPRFDHTIGWWCCAAPGIIPGADTREL
jgi:hypothetical protein